MLKSTEKKNEPLPVIESFVLLSLNFEPIDQKSRQYKQKGWGRKFQISRTVTQTQTEEKALGLDDNTSHNSCSFSVSIGPRFALSRGGVVGLSEGIFDTLQISVHTHTPNKASKRAANERGKLSTGRLLLDLYWRGFVSQTWRQRATAWRLSFFPFRLFIFSTFKQPPPACWS